MNESKHTNEICPLLSAAAQGNLVSCHREACAWWLQYGGCAMACIPTALDNISDSIDTID